MRPASVFLTALVSALFSLPTPAAAQWSYANWGMSVEEVLSASGAAAHKVKDKGDTRILNHRQLALATAAISDIPVEVSFYFDPKAEKLTKVNFTPAKTDCAKLLESQLALLGKIEPVRKIDQIMADRPPLVQDKYLWRDPKGLGTITFMTVSFGADMAYCQILHEQ